MTHFRTDRGTLQSPQRLPNGFTRFDAFIGRTGILEYSREGKIVREYRPPEEAFNPTTLASFASAPLTDGHPPDGMLDVTNTRGLQVGTVEAPRRDGNMVRASVLVTSAEALEAIQSGKVELSMGYCCEVDPTPGVTPDGQRYDAVQRAVIGNHLALVDQGRAGPEVRLRADASTGAAPPDAALCAFIHERTGLRVDGKDEAYVDAALDLAFSCGDHRGVTYTDDDGPDSDVLAGAMEKRTANAWKDQSARDFDARTDGLSYEELEAAVKERSRGACKVNR